MNYPEIINRVAIELNLPSNVVKKAYESYWKFIRETIKSLPLKEEVTEERFNGLRTNFNIPSIGKLSCTYDRMVRVKKKFERIRQLKEK